MKRPVRSTPIHSLFPGKPLGYTMVEVLLATTLTLIMVYGVVKMFSMVGTSIQETRAVVETADRLRTAAARLQLDLGGATATMLPPLRPAENPGYFEYIEGASTLSAVNSMTPNVDGSFPADPTVIDVDDILMLTTRSKNRPFVGRYAGGTLESDVAEVAWFVRGRTLHRRVLLVAPGVSVSGANGFYENNDVSVHRTGSGLVANSLGDLTKRENRYAHDTSGFPFDARGWGQLGLPTLRECSSSSYTAGGESPIWQSAAQMDYWAVNPYLLNDAPVWDEVDPQTGTLNAYPDPDPPGRTRIAEDVILTNVIGFDVKAFFAGSGNYADLAYSHEDKSQLTFDTSTARVYCTGSSHYEHNGIDEDGELGDDQGTNGFDDDGNGEVDDLGERETSPPYPIPLRGIKVTIRVFEPFSRQVREVAVVQDFLPK